MMVCVDFFQTSSFGLLCLLSLRRIGDGMTFSRERVMGRVKICKCFLGSSWFVLLLLRLLRLLLLLSILITRCTSTRLTNRKGREKKGIVGAEITSGQLIERLLAFDDSTGIAAKGVSESENARVYCSACGKIHPGGEEEECWVKYPEKKAQLRNGAYLSKK